MKDKVSPTTLEKIQGWIGDYEANKTSPPAPDPQTYPTKPNTEGFEWTWDGDEWVETPIEEEKPITEVPYPTTPPTEGYEWYWDGEKWVESPIEEDITIPPGYTIDEETGYLRDAEGNLYFQDPVTGQLTLVTPGVGDVPPPFPTEPPPPGYAWQYDPETNTNIPAYTGEDEPYTMPPMPTEPAPSGYIWDYNPNTGQWELTPGELPGGVEPITPYQQEQLDLDNRVLELQQQGMQADQAYRQAQLEQQLQMFLKPYEQLTLAEQQQFGLDKEKFEWQKSQWQQQFTQEQQRHLAELAAEPISWLQYSLEAKEPAVVQPWMQPLMFGQYQGMQPGEIIPGSTLPTAPTAPTAPTPPTAPTLPTAPTQPTAPTGQVVGQPAAPTGMAAPIPPPTDYEAWKDNQETAHRAWIQEIIVQLQAHWATVPGGVPPEVQQAKIDELWAGHYNYDYAGQYAMLQSDYDQQKWAYDQQIMRQQQQPTQQQLWQQPTAQQQAYQQQMTAYGQQQQAYPAQQQAYEQEMAAYAQQQRDYEQQMGKGLTGMPELLRPSRQYQARMGPTAEQMYYGYEQARTRARPEEQSWRLWSSAPPSGQHPGLTYRR